MTNASEPAPLTLESPRADFRVEFHWQHDRFMQSLFASGTQSPSQSVEGGADETWPPSPPIQQVSLETINGKNVILGVGAAGQNHWSISVEPFVSAHASGLRFDLACRCKSNPIGLGSTYTIDPRFQIEPEETSTMLHDDRTVSIRPESVACGSTIRWGYRIALR